MKNIHTICRKVAKLTDQELATADSEAAEQWTYLHPLKLARAARVHAAGNHNQRVLAKLRELRDTILAGANPSHITETDRREAERETA
jgi:hypothetical protein